MRWLHNRDSHPDTYYLVSAPVSLPLIGLTGLTGLTGLSLDGMSVDGVSVAGLAVAGLIGLTGMSMIGLVGLTALVGLTVGWSGCAGSSIWKPAPASVADANLLTLLPSCGGSVGAARLA